MKVFYDLISFNPTAKANVCVYAKAYSNTTLYIFH